MLLPQVVGFKLTGELSQLATSTDLVLTITKQLRSLGVVGKFVEFFGPGARQLSIADRATVANMCPEFGATVAFFPIDETSLQYLVQTNRSAEKIALIEKYLRLTKQFRNYDDELEDPVFSQVVELDLSTVVTSVSGPKRPQDRVSVVDMKQDFESCLTNKINHMSTGEIAAIYIKTLIILRGTPSGPLDRRPYWLDEEGRGPSVVALLGRDLCTAVDDYGLMMMMMLLAR
ncbi:unnamed protein product [Plutella xylostella]|uniref:(diamondback moth) hypothetical protein n=1 Tax=Plutella xylostella TaxID=51655 RepID=A0A8S4G8U8_PLUXY|nr:unnamed protein product [Plutella xylostella]